MKSLGEAEKYGYPHYVANRTYYSLIGRNYEWELMPLGLDQGVGSIVWGPLGWSRLTGKIRRTQLRPNTSRLHDTGFVAQVSDDLFYGVIDALDAVTAETCKAVAQVAPNWPAPQKSLELDPVEKVWE